VFSSETLPLLYLQGSLDGLITILLYFQAVPVWSEIVEAAWRQALTDHATRRTVEHCCSADDIGYDVNGAGNLAREPGGHRVLRLRLLCLRRRLRRVVIFDMVDQGWLARVAQGT